jgi:hypothetical protein
MSANAKPSYAQASRLDTLLANARSANAWDANRSRRVFEGAVRSRAARGRRQRFVAFACAASAALFVLGVHAAGSRTRSFQVDESNESSPFTSNSSNSGTGDSIGISGGTTYGTTYGTSGAIAMSSDMFADGGRETD